MNKIHEQLHEQVKTEIEAELKKLIEAEREYLLDNGWITNGGDLYSSARHKKLKIKSWDAVNFQKQFDNRKLK